MVRRFSPLRGSFRFATTHHDTLPLTPNPTPC